MILHGDNNVIDVILLTASELRNKKWFFPIYAARGVYEDDRALGSGYAGLGQ